MLRCLNRASSSYILCSRLPCGTLQKASFQIEKMGLMPNGKIDTSKINVDIMGLQGNDAIANIAGAASRRVQIKLSLYLFYNYLAESFCEPISRVLIKRSYGRVTFIRRDSKGQILEQHGWMEDSALGHLSFYYLHNPIFEELEQEEIDEATFQYDIVEASHLGIHIVNARIVDKESGKWLGRD